MADYWKSNERKHCSFCNCWISDNKPSIAFHENGKRHQMNVAKRISEVSRNSEKAERERIKMDSDIRKMEEAAMRSYTRDIHARGDMTANTLNAVMAARAAGVGQMTMPSESGAATSSTASAARPRQHDPLRLAGNSDDEDDRRVFVKRVEPDEVPNASLWVEAKNDEGYTYYWNVKTNESVWEKPKEGYLSLAEYEKINEIALKQQEMEQAVEAKKFRENANEEVARYNRERLKQFRPRETVQEKKAKVEEKQAYKTEEEAQNPEIGAWQVVVEKPPSPKVDLQLPKLDNYYVAPVVTNVYEPPPVKRFKEKVLEKPLLDEDTAAIGTTFKKRKFAAKGNARQRLNDD